MQDYEASTLAYDVTSMIDVCLYAHENETTAVPLDQRGIDRVLQMAAEKASNLIDMVERLEIDLRAATRKGGDH